MVLRVTTLQRLSQEADIDRQRMSSEYFGTLPFLQIFDISQNNRL